MKHLKLFEDIGDKNEYYEEINREKFGSLFHNQEEWEFNEIDTLKDALETEEKDSDGSTYVDVGDSYITIIDDITDVSMIKVYDYWFLVSIEYKKYYKTKINYYLCDQFDGLMELLKYIELI